MSDWEWRDGYLVMSTSEAAEQVCGSGDCIAYAMAGYGMWTLDVAEELHSKWLECYRRNIAREAAFEEAEAWEPCGEEGHMPGCICFKREATNEPR